MDNMRISFDIKTLIIGELQMYYTIVICLTNHKTIFTSRPELSIPAIEEFIEDLRYGSLTIEIIPHETYINKYVISVAGADGEWIFRSEMYESHQAARKTLGRFLTADMTDNVVTINYSEPDEETAKKINSSLQI